MANGQSECPGQLISQKLLTSVAHETDWPWEKRSQKPRNTATSCQRKNMKNDSQENHGKPPRNMCVRHAYQTTKSSAEPGFHIDVIRKAPFANANICKPHQRSSKCRFHSFSLITCHCADLSNTNCACQQALQHWPSGAVIR